MKFIVNGELRTIELKKWESYSNQYSPDCFDDMEPNLKAPAYTQDYIPEEGYVYVCTTEKFDDLVSFWEKECDDYNDGKCSEVLGQKNEDGNDDDDFTLFVDYFAE